MDINDLDDPLSLRLMPFVWTGAIHAETKDALGFGDRIVKPFGTGWWHRG